MIPNPRSEIRNPQWPEFLSRLGPLAAQTLARTWRWDVIGADRLEATMGPRLWVLWHGELLPLLWLHRGRGITVLASLHRDGGYLAGVAQRWGYRVLRGSTARSGTSALRGVIRVLRAGGEAALALDGPRGPRHEAKPGAALAAMRSRALVVPVRAQCRPGWRLASWDGFLIPAPFARIRVMYGEPTRLHDADARGAGRVRLEQQLSGLAGC